MNASKTVVRKKSKRIKKENKMIRFEEIIEESNDAIEQMLCCKKIKHSEEL